MKTTKPVIYLVIIMLLTTGVNAQSINLNQNSVIDNVNEYEIVKHIAAEYDSILISIDDYEVVLIFSDTKLTKIEQYSNQEYDFKVTLDREQVDYLLNNYEKMSIFDKFKFLISTDIPFKDVMTLSGIAMEVRT